MRKFKKNNYVPAEYGGYMFPKCNIPDIRPGDAGKVLTVNETETGIKWAEAGDSELFIVNWVESNGVSQMDKTWQEINDALAAHKQCYFCSIVPNSSVSMWPITSAVVYEGVYSIYFANIGGIINFYTNSPSGYPKYTGD